MNPIIEKDLRHFWRPATQMKDYENFEPLLVDSARGSRLFLRDGRVLVDGISSWWCKSLGHSHPAVRKAFIDQVMKFEHVIMANCAAEPVAELCATLAELLPPLDRVFIAENGSVSVEVALNEHAVSCADGASGKDSLCRTPQRISRRNGSHDGRRRL